MADDNYVRQLATMFKQNLNAGFVIYLEYSNEVWNPAFGDNGENGQYTYANQQGLAQNLPDCSADKIWECGKRFYAKRSVEIFDIFEEVFGGTEQIVRVLSTQPVAHTAKIILEFQDAWKKCDALAIHSYFGHPFISSDMINTVTKWTPEQLIDSCIVDIKTRVRDRCRSIKDELDAIKSAHKRDIKLIAYEGGQHLAGRCSWTNDACSDLFIAANRHPKMKDAYRELFSMWNSIGGSLFCHFSSVSTPGIYGSWGVLENPDQDPATAPRYQGLLEAMDKYPWPEGTVAQKSAASRNAGADNKFRIDISRRQLTVQHAAGAVVSVYSPDGACVFAQKSAGKSTRLSLGMLGTGVYIIRAVAPHKAYTRATAVALR
jgi:hypothetical protein